jgi:hypothetical protein
VRVYITHSPDRELWGQISALVPYAHISGQYFKSFEIEELSNKMLLCKLGDNTFGKIPENGDSIGIEYIVSDGVIINTVSDTIYDTNNNVITNLSVSNITGATGGVDRETTADIKRNAPAVFATGDRAVTKQDHVAILRQDSTVDKVYVESERDLNPPNYNMFNRINLYILRKLDQNGDPMPIDDAWLFGSSAGASVNFPDVGSLLDRLYRNAMITTKYVILSGSIVKVDVDENVYMKYGQDIAIAKNNVETKVRDFLSYDNRELNDDILKSVVTSEANSALGVQYTEIDLKVYNALSNNGVIVSPTTVSLAPIARGNFGLYANGLQVGKDNGSGGIIPFPDYTSSYNVGSGNINYTTGVVDVSFNVAPPAGTVYCRYKQGKRVDYIIQNAKVSWNGSLGWEHQITYNAASTPIVPNSFRMKIDGVDIGQDISLNSVSGNIWYADSYNGLYTFIGSGNINYVSGVITMYLNYLGNPPSTTAPIPSRAYFDFGYSQDLPSDDISVGATQVAIVNNVVSDMRYLGQ